MIRVPIDGPWLGISSRFNPDLSGFIAKDNLKTRSEPTQTDSPKLTIATFDSPFQLSANLIISRRDTDSSPIILMLSGAQLSSWERFA